MPVSTATHRNPVGDLRVVFLGKRATMSSSRPMTSAGHAARRCLGAAAVAAVALASVTMAGAAGAAGPSAPGAAASGVVAHPALPASTSASAPRRKPPAKPLKLVDLNSASKAELKTLPGIGDVEADAIVRNRPYRTKTELVTKKVLPTGPYLSLKNKVVAMPKAPPKPKPKPKPEPDTKPQP